MTQRKITTRLKSGSAITVVMDQFDVDKEVPKRHERKPDKSEPWRYVSPCCLVQINSKRGTTYYVCNSCGEYYTRQELVDKRWSDGDLDEYEE